MISRVAALPVAVRARFEIEPPAAVGPLVFGEPFERRFDGRFAPRGAAAGQRRGATIGESSVLPARRRATPRGLAKRFDRIADLAAFGDGRDRSARRERAADLRRRRLAGRRADRIARAPGSEISSLFTNGPSEGFEGSSGISLRSISRSSTGATSNPPETQSGSLLGVASRISDRMISSAAWTTALDSQAKIPDSSIHSSTRRRHERLGSAAVGARGRLARAEGASRRVACRRSAAAGGTSPAGPAVREKQADCWPEGKTSRLFRSASGAARLVNYSGGAVFPRCATARRRQVCRAKP